MTPETAAPDPAALAAAVAARTERSRATFDPSRHKARPDGSPFITKEGRLLPIGGRRKAGAPSTLAPAAEPARIEPAACPGPSTPAPAPAAEPPPAAKPDFSDVAKIVREAGATGPADGNAVLAPVEVVESVSHEASTEGLLRGSYVVADALLSGRGEWQPEDQTEHNALKAAFVAWQKARGGKPPSPGWGFVLSVVAFVAKRVRKPNTAKTLVKWFPDLAPVLGVDLEPKPAGKPDPKPQPAAKPEPMPAPAAPRAPVDVTSRFFDS